MPHRRAAGIVAAFLLIPQLLGAREGACPSHSENHAPAAAATAPVEGHEHHHQSSGQGTPRDQHLPSDCCPAMSTCSSGVAIQIADAALTSWSWHNDEPAEVVTHTRSRVESPDPPPPKA